MFTRAGADGKKTVSRPYALFLCVIVLSFSLYGCAGMSPKTKATLTCGVAGGLLGAVIGAAIDSKNRARGAAIGAVIGAVGAMGACFAIASYQSTQVADHETTARQVDYTPESGDVVRITDFRIDPSAVNPGGEVAFLAQYYVMTPNPAQDINVIETRTIKAYDEDTGTYTELGSTANEVTMRPGTRQGDGVINIHGLTPDGNYMLSFSVDYGGTIVHAEKPLTVGNAPVLAAASEPEGTKTVSTQEQTSVDTTDKFFVIVVETTALRSGSGPTYDIVSLLRLGEVYPIKETYKNPENNITWHKIALDDGREGWVSSAAGRVE